MGSWKNVWVENSWNPSEDLSVIQSNVPKLSLGVNKSITWCYKMRPLEKTGWSLYRIPPCSCRHLPVNLGIIPEQSLQTNNNKKFLWEVTCPGKEEAKGVLWPVCGFEEHLPSHSFSAPVAQTEHPTGMKLTALMCTDRLLIPSHPSARTVFPAVQKPRSQKAPSVFSLFLHFIWPPA